MLVSFMCDTYLVLIRYLDKTFTTTNPKAVAQARELGISYSCDSETLALPSWYFSLLIIMLYPNKIQYSDQFGISFDWESWNGGWVGLFMYSVLKELVNAHIIHPYLLPRNSEMMRKGSHEI
jgi:hypothetical protein